MRRILFQGPLGVSVSVVRDMWRELPKLWEPEEAEVAWIHEGSGLGCPQGFGRPFRAPHHSVSDVGMAGKLTPRKLYLGEVCLAHNGVLFLDDLTEFRPSTIDAIAETLNAGSSLGIPCKPAILVATARFCQCGYFARSPSSCKCTDMEFADHQKRLIEYTMQLGIEETRFVR